MIDSVALVRLKLGVDPLEAAKKLHEVAGPVDPNGGSLLILGNDQLVNAYIAWVNEVERVLFHYFRDPDLVALHTARFWHVNETGASLPRFSETMREEMSRQFDRLTEIASDLEFETQRLRGDIEATIAVVDTNVFLHCHPLETFQWRFVSSGPVRVVVPVRVIEELDDRKRDRNSDIADRARKSIRWLREKLVESTTQRPMLRAEVTLESYTPAGRRDPIPSADTEILESCETLETFSGRPVSIVTADLGMQLRGLAYRGRASGLSVKLVPDEYRLGATLPQTS